LAVCGLRWRRWALTLQRERSKNGEPRRVPFVDEISKIMTRRHEARGESRYVFQRNGKTSSPRVSISQAR
jgi:hypothetical protein